MELSRICVHLGRSCCMENTGFFFRFCASSDLHCEHISRSQWVGRETSQGQILPSFLARHACPEMKLSQGSVVGRTPNWKKSRVPLVNPSKREDNIIIVQRLVNILFLDDRVYGWWSVSFCFYNSISSGEGLNSEQLLLLSIIKLIFHITYKKQLRSATHFWKPLLHNLVWLPNSIFHITYNKRLRSATLCCWYPFQKASAA